MMTTDNTLRPLLPGIHRYDDVTDAMVDAMRARFNALLAPGQDWKLGIEARIPDADFDAYNEACLWFTGSPLTRASIVDRQDMVSVKAEGYYAAVGA